MDGAGPSWQDLGALACRPKKTTLGPDGLRFAAWAQPGCVAWQAFGRVQWEVLEGMPVPRAFVDSLMVFLPKGGEAVDSERVVRSSATLRQNTDLKLTCGALNDDVSGVDTSSGAQGAQCVSSSGRATWSLTSSSWTLRRGVWPSEALSTCFR